MDEVGSEQKNMSEFDNISTDSDEESIINRVFPAEFLIDDSTVSTNVSSTIDLEAIKVRVKESFPKRFNPTQEELVELNQYIDEHKVEIQKDGESIDTGNLQEEIEDAYNNEPEFNPAAGTGDAPGDGQGAAVISEQVNPNTAVGPNSGPTVQSDGANNQPPQPPAPIPVKIKKQELIDAINKNNQQLEPQKTTVEYIDDELVVTVQKDPSKAGGKSKKKQIKPKKSKNKSNKKMKKKQTKKGGKQIKKRSLKRKMKK